MRGDDRVAAGHELAADLRRAAHHESRREEAVLAQIAVMRDVADVVQLRAGANVRRGQGRSINRAIAADLDAVADDDIAEMRDFARLARGIHRITKPVAANAGVRMNLAIIADLASRPHEHVRMQDAARTDYC